MANQHIADEGDLRKYRTEIPNIIDDLGLDPYQRALYTHYKRVCGANGGACEEGVRKTATKTKMSMGKVSQVRSELAEIGLIIEHTQPLKDGQINAQVYVTIIDIWELNFAYYSYKDGRPDITGWSIAQLAEWVKRSYYERSRYERSPGKRQRSGSEQQEDESRSPGEQKKEPSLSKKEPLEERGAAEKTPPAPSLRQQAENGEMTTETEIQVLCGFGRQGKAGVADPSQDIGQYVKFRDDVLQIFDDAGGDWGRTKKQRDARRDAIIRFANDQGDFDLECWRNALHTSIVLGGVQPDNLACFFDVYKAGGDYQEMCSQRKNGGKPNAKNSRHSSGSGISGNRRKPAYSVADPAQFDAARTPDDP